MAHSGWIRRLPIVFALLVAGCSAGGGGSEQAAARDHAKAKAGWLLSIEDGAPAGRMPIERFDVYLVEDDHEQETFELYGEGFLLAGAFPMDVRVGYEENYDALVGGTIAILPSGGGDRSQERHSSIRLDGAEVPVLGGDLMVEGISGHWTGSEGDKTVRGRFTLRVPGPDGERVIRGTFAAQIVTWG